MAECVNSKGGENNMKKLRSFFVLAAAAAALVLFLFPGTEIKAAGTATLNSAVIQGNQVVVTGTASVASEDGILHLYAQNPYESGAQGIEVAQAPNGTASFTFSLNKNSANSNLFKKFTVVAIQNGIPTAVSNSVYITNPEAALHIRQPDVMAESRESCLQLSF